MAVLEIGINLGMRPLVEIQYYSPSDEILDHNIRARFLNGLEDFISEVYGDEVNVISLSSFEIICYNKIVQLPRDNGHNSQSLLIYAIIDKETDHNFIKQHLEEIISRFLKNFSLNDIFSKSAKFFKKFEPHIDKILGDLRLNIEDRIRTVFREEIKEEEKKKKRKDKKL